MNAKNCTVCCKSINMPYIRRNPKCQSITEACIDASHAEHVEENGVSYVAWFNRPEAKQYRKNQKIRLKKILG